MITTALLGLALAAAPVEDIAAQFGAETQADEHLLHGLRRRPTATASGPDGAVIGAIVRRRRVHRRSARRSLPAAAVPTTVAAAAPAATRFGDGIWLVGTDMAPGNYRAVIDSDGLLRLLRLLAGSPTCSGDGDRRATTRIRRGRAGARDHRADATSPSRRTAAANGRWSDVRPQPVPRDCPTPAPATRRIELGCACGSPFELGLTLPAADRSVRGATAGHGQTLGAGGTRAAPAVGVVAGIAVDIAAVAVCTAAHRGGGMARRLSAFRPEPTDSLRDGSPTACTG